MANYFDREVAAHAEAVKAFRINPNYSLEESKKRWPSSDPVLQARCDELMKKVGFK